MTTETNERRDIDEANDFLMGGSIAAFKFENLGDVASGQVAHAEVRKQTDIKTGEPLFWNDGNPRQQLVVTLQMPPEHEEDDGLRRIFVKGQMAAAVRDAVSAVGERGIGIGGKLAVKWEEEEAPTTRGFSPTKIYKAWYEAPPPPQTEVPTDDDRPF